LAGNLLTNLLKGAALSALSITIRITHIQTVKHAGFDFNLLGKISSRCCNGLGTGVGLKSKTPV
jgi:hypothetical protein